MYSLCSRLLFSPHEQVCLCETMSGMCYLPVCVWAWSGAGSDRSSCGKGRRRCRGSGLFHLSSRVGWRSHHSSHTHGPLCRIQMEENQREFYIIKKFTSLQFTNQLKWSEAAKMFKGFKWRRTAHGGAIWSGMLSKLISRYVIWPFPSIAH